tara:strand:+ start:922 stop:1824 length:903 start_codon:yes stop_codon:yes gene_type:complete
MTLFFLAQYLYQIYQFQSLRFKIHRIHLLKYQHLYFMDLQLKGKLALVTGSTAGIGLAIATSLAKEGAAVYVNGRTEQRIENAIASIKREVPEAKLYSAIADFSNKRDVEALIDNVTDVDILINNVGIFAPLEYDQITDEDWYHMWDVNVMSGIRLSRAYMPKMIKKNWGRIVFISSESGVQIPEDMIHYGVSKTAQIAVSRGLAQATRGTNVTVNSVLPGSTWSEGAENYFKELAAVQGKSIEAISKGFVKEMRPSCLIERFASTDEVAHMVTYLCSPLASATNGAAVRADGGTVPTII